MSLLMRSIEVGRLGKRLPFFTKGPSQTKTSFASDCDINVIVARFLKTGQLPQAVVPPAYMDTTQVPVGTDALMAIRTAQQAFEQLPLALRREIGHDPRALEPWLKDPSNEDRARKFGLLVDAIPANGTPIPKAGEAAGAGAPAAASAPGGVAGDGAPAKS